VEAEVPERWPAKVVDLMEVLKRSLEGKRLRTQASAAKEKKPGPKRRAA